MKSNIYIKLSALLLLSACMPNTPINTDHGHPPTDYKNTMKSYIKENFFDPYSLRDVEISNPKPGRIGQNFGYLFCLKLNAKNRNGGYVGLSKNAYLIKNNIVIISEENSEYCQNINYSKWKEMEGR